MPGNHEVHLLKYTFEGTQDLWLAIRTMIIKSANGIHMAPPGGERHSDLSQ